MHCQAKWISSTPILTIRNSIQWMDFRKITKNTFHYNAMISVTEKAQDYRRALALMVEMSDRGVEKNEVTYVPSDRML
jgi:pentatricopeptide repeat protein